MGRVGRPHGVRGEVRMWPHNPATPTLVPGATLHVGRTVKRATPLQLERVRHDAKGPIVRFVDHDRREDAEALNGAEWFASREHFAPLAAGEIYIVDLVGAQVSTVDGQHVGEIVDVVQVGPADLLVVRAGTPETGTREILVPNVEAFIERLDVAAGQVVIRPIPGLLDDE